MSYIDNNLLPNEMVEARARIHWFIYFPALLFFLFSCAMFTDADTRAFGVTLFILVPVFYIRAFIEKTSTELAVTNKRVIAKHGFVSRQTIELNLSKVESLSVNQSLFGRMFNYGKVTVNGTGGIKTPFKFIADPLALRRAVNVQIEKLNPKSDV